MKYLLLLILLASYQSLACIPCDKDAVVVILHQVEPNFDQSFRSSEMVGFVRFKLDANRKGNIENVDITEIFPSDVPKKALREMIDNSTFSTRTTSPEKANCGVKGFELTVEFLLPQKVDIEMELPGVSNR